LLGKSERAGPLTSDLDPASFSAHADAERLLIDVLTGRPDTGLYAAYQMIRERAPVLRMRHGILVLTRFDDVRAALRHPDVGKPEQGFGARHGQVDSEQVQQAMARWQQTILFADPPAHTRLRRLISDVFTPRHIEQMRAAAAAAADGCLDRLEDQQAADFVGLVAQPMPARVIAEMLGIPGSDYANFGPVVRRAVELFEPTADARSVGEAIRAHDELSEYLSGLLEDKRRAPGEDLLSRLASSRAADKMDSTEMIATAVLLFAGGFETTVNLLSNGLYALLTHPDQLGILQADPGLVPTAVEEFLRFDSPVQLTSRAVQRECVLAGTELEPGQQILLMLGAANRDPAQFTEPDKLDVTRDEGPALSLGSGIHFCLGAHLARLEAAELFTRLLRRFPHLELAGRPRRRPGRSLRGFAELPITARR
jgi:cytochrome P450